MQRLSTFSIVGRCERTGQLGVAVSTADVGAGRLVTWARAGVGAVATQSWPSLYLAIDALDLMASGVGAQVALDRVLAQDPGRGLRQLGAVDAAGGTTTFSGDECTDWYGGATGPGFAAQGNMLLGGETVSAMASSFGTTAELDLAARLLRALEAGQAAGGDTAPAAGLGRGQAAGPGIEARVVHGSSSSLGPARSHAPRPSGPRHRRS